jgi:AraC family transcriptional regulator
MLVLQQPEVRAMTHSIQVVDVEDRTVLARELIAEETELGHAIETTLGAEYQYAEASGLHPAGPPFVVYRDRVGAHRWSIEICAPIAEVPAGTPPGDLGVEWIPAGRVAKTVHRGPYETLGEAYDDLAQWIGEHGYTPAGPPREIYLSEPETPPEEISTIVEIPVMACPDDATAATP